MKLPSRNIDAHKGEYGKVLIVAGSKKYYGAPIFNALGAELSGADLITLYLPVEHVECAKRHSLNLFIRNFVKGDLGLKDYSLIVDEALTNHVLLIGSGLGTDRDTKRIVKMVLTDITCPAVIDADALIPGILDIERKSQWVITPHKGEFRRLFSCEPTEENVQQVAKQYNLVVLLKDRVDIIAGNGKVYLNKTGCPQMRVGGTGDALAGIVASFIAQGLPLFESAQSATHYFGLCGESLVRKRKYFTTQQLIKYFPKFLAHGTFYSYS